MPTATTASHSHRPTTKTQHKSFKSKKATKGALRDQAKGRVPPNEKRKTPHQQVMSKLERKNQARQRQSEKVKAHKQETSVFSGRDGAPRHVAVLPLCTDGDVQAAIASLNSSIDLTADIDATTSHFRVPIDRFKQTIQYIPTKRDLTAALDAARVADYVVLVLSAVQEVDKLGELILRGIETQGLSTVFTVIQGLESIEPAKQRQSVLGSLRSFITHFHPEQEKLYSLGNRQECSNLMRSLCSTTPKGIKWRDERSWMLIENAVFGSDGSTILTGVVRGKGLKADRLVQVGDWGAFQIEKIVAAPLERRMKKQQDMVDTDTEEVLEVPTDDRDDMLELAPEEAVMKDVDDDIPDTATNATGPSRRGVLLDDHHYFSDPENEAYTDKRRVPKGTSKYQAAWLLDDDVSDSGSDMEDIDMTENDAAEEEPPRPEDGTEGMADDIQTEAGPSEYPVSEMVDEDMDDDKAAEQVAAFREMKHRAAKDDLQFPDEIELDPNALARERLARYRGLKSMRESKWEEDEDAAHEPEDWQRLLRVKDYQGWQGSRVRAAREALIGGVRPGTRVHVYVKDVPASAQHTYNVTTPLPLFSLLRHEHKKTVVNFVMNLSNDYGKSIRAKEELIVQCGPRRFVINPLFSTMGSTPNDVHKYCRFLHPGQSAVATFRGPVTWGSVPTLFFKRKTNTESGDTTTTTTTTTDDEEEPDLPLALIGSGTALAPSTSRVITKRVVLTGHPYHIHKKIVTIRYMFFNREDVDWFKALPLWTKKGREGYIKEALGTHGYFKATFDSRINSQDTVGVSLYKRVWPRDAKPCQPGLLDLAKEIEQDKMAED